MSSHAATHRDHPDPRLRTRYYAAPLERVWEAAREALRETPGFALTAEAPEAGELRGVHTARLMRGKDDLVVSILESETGETELDARVEARGGLFVFAKSAGALPLLLGEIDRRLTPST
ncbi:MAG TPA: hypothetical protein VNZ52_10400 [Candidatus Thermoplasmatota archaeon]|nr:hypothetical protein [Candidatus Thermoplasmatota archaeon]